MEIFAKILQGPYAYLLVLQVLIVSGLCLTLIYLILLRLREMPAQSVGVALHMVPDPSVTQVKMEAASQPVLTSAPPAPLAAAPSSEPMGIPEIFTAPIPEALVSPIPVSNEAALPSSLGGADPQTVIAEKERNSALEQEAAATKDKVRYLESKLLEYEILQEEIGALSSLKVENEKLRQELMAAKQAKPPAPVVAGPAAEISVEPKVRAAADATSELLSADANETEAFAAGPGVDIADNPVAKSQVDNIITEVQTLTNMSKKE